MSDPRTGIVLGIIAAAVVLAGCGGQQEPSPLASAAASASSSAAAWSPEAVTACRVFANGASAMLPVAKNQLTKYRAGMTAADPGAAAVGWRLVDGGTTLPANIGMNAEPEVYKALAAVVAAKDLPFLARGTEAGGLGNDAQNAAVATTFVRAHSDAWAAAIDVCTRVGVIK